MKNLPIALKVIINIVLFIIYYVIGSVLGGFLFGWVYSLMGTSIPVESDLIYTKMAGIIFLIILVLTVILRKYFYISLHTKDETEKVTIKVEK